MSYCKEQATRDLELAERAFLLAHGWQPTHPDRDLWIGPAKMVHRVKQYDRKHAMNRMKYELEKVSIRQNVVESNEEAQSKQRRRQLERTQTVTR